MNLPIEMYKKYIERRKTDMDQLREAVNSGAADVFKRIGHQIRGNAASFGFDDLAALGNRMEEVETSNLTSEGRDILSQLTSWVENKEKEFAGLD